MKADEASHDLGTRPAIGSSIQRARLEEEGAQISRKEASQVICHQMNRLAERVGLGVGSLRRSHLDMQQ